MTKRGDLGVSERKNVRLVPGTGRTILGEGMIIIWFYELMRFAGYFLKFGFHIPENRI